MSPNAIPLRSAVSEWLQHRANEGRDPKTIESYRHAAHLLQEYLASTGEGNPTISDVDRAVVRGFIAWLKERRVVRKLAPRPIERTLSPATVNNYVRSIRNLYNWLVSEEYIAADATPFVARSGLVPKIPKKPRKIPSVAEVERIDAQVERESRGSAASRRASRTVGLRNRAVWLVMLDAGLRVGEVCALNVADYQRSGRLQVRESKQGNSRDLGIGGETRIALDRYLRSPRRNLLANRFPDQEREAVREAVEMSGLLGGEKPRYAPSLSPYDREPALFLGRDGFRLTAGAIRLWMEDLCKRAGVPVYSPHTIRHHYGTRQAASGMPVELLRQAMGHSSITTTQIYFAENPAAVQEAMQFYSPVDAMHRAAATKGRRARP